MKALLLAGILALAPVPASAIEPPLTVVELFTSQGCSSCPPADAFLGDLARRDDVLALSFHVDYWDYIGWKDPYARADHTRRQRDYARRLGLRYVYTPQMVIQGTTQAVGSDEPAVLSRIAAAGDTDRVDVALRRDDGGHIIASIPKAATGEEATVWMVVFDSVHVTDVKRGENTGRTVRNYNVVRSISPIATWRGDALEIPAPISEMTARDSDTCAIILQSTRTGRILGAAKMALARTD